MILKILHYSGGKKKVQFKCGSDGNDYVWVMGDHKNDKSVEQIMEEEAIAKSLKDAEKEMETWRINEEKELAKRMEEEQKKIEEEKKSEMRYNTMDSLYLLIILPDV